MAYRGAAGAAPRPMNPPMLSSRPAQPAGLNQSGSLPPAVGSDRNNAGGPGRVSPVLVRQAMPSSFESQPTSAPRPAPQPPTAAGTAATGSQQASQSPGSTQPRAPPLSIEESTRIARTHHAALKRWLAQEGALDSAATRTNAREKLTRLTRQQFQELSTDVYDELQRRLNDSAEGDQGKLGFLAVRPEFHPKRNQARQKLATLPTSRFRDLGSDVYFELDRRYPEFNEEGETVEPLRWGGQSGSATAGLPYQPQQPQQPQPQRADPKTSPQLSRDGSLGSSHSHSLSGGQQQPYPPRQGTSSPSPAPPTNLNAQRRVPTPTSQTAYSSPSQASAKLPPAVPLIPGAGSVPTPTSNEVVVPNKSTMRVEEPAHSGGNATAHEEEQPETSPPASATSSHFAAPSAPSPGASTRAGNVVAAALARSASATSNTYSPQQQQAPQTPQNYSPSPSARQVAPKSNGSPTNSMREQPQSPDRNAGYGYDQGMPSPGFMHTSRASEASSNGMMSRFVGAYGAAESQYAPSQAGASEAGRQSWEPNRASVSEQIEQVRASYEYKLTMLQNRVSELESAAQQRNPEDEERMRSLEQELEERDRRLQELTQENDTLRSRPPAPPEETSSPNAQPSPQFRARIQKAEALVSELRGELSALVSETERPGDASDDSHELRAELERERTERERLQSDMTALQSRHEQAVEDLENLRAASALLTSPQSPTGDITPSLTGNARHDPVSTPPATAELPQRSDSLRQQQQQQQRAAEAVPAVPGKAQGYFSGGFSSVKHALGTLGLSSPPSARQGQPATAAVQDERPADTEAPQRSPTSPPPRSTSRAGHGNAYQPMSPPAGASPPPSQRQLDHSSFSTSTSVSSPPRSYEQHGQVPMPPIPPAHDPQPEWQPEDPAHGAIAQDAAGYPSQQQYDQQEPQHHQYATYDAAAQPEYDYGGSQYGRAPQGMVSSPVIGGQERDPEELRAYVENQTELIVHSIQALLSAIRSGASSSDLNDSLNQIVTIVSSIVAISQQALPATDAEADAVLQDLTSHCNRLNDMQNAAVYGNGNGQPVFTKQTKQAMAAASFGVAKSLKQLNGLLNAGPDSLT